METPYPFAGKLKTFLLSLALIIFLNPVVNAQLGSEKSILKASQIDKYEGYSNKDYKGFKYSSYYVTMRDSIRIAVDVFLPKKMERGEEVPTVMYLTRYVRSLKAKFPFSLLKNPILAQVSEKEINFFTSNGYACVIVDARGSGASEGDRIMEFSPNEIKDGGEIIDWIISKSWSDGKVATTGISYLGTTSELILVNKHPAVKAAIPRSNIFDLYGHIMFPGGMRQGPFINIWGYTTKNLDANNFEPFTSKHKLLVGINPVKGDRRRKIYKQVMENHKSNFDVYEGLLKVDFRDEVHPDFEEYTADIFSVHNYIDDIEASGTPIYRIGGWYDGALQKSVIDGFRNTLNTAKVLLGPWDHGPAANASPHAESKDVGLDVYSEMLRFLDYHVKGIENGIDKEPKFYYYTIGEKKWKGVNEWPLKNEVQETFYLSQNNTLALTKGNVEPGVLQYAIDTTATTGVSSRWNSVTGLYKTGDTNYPLRNEESARLLNFNSPPFSQDVVMTGHPLAEIYLSADATDAGLFVYVEDVAPNGDVFYVTEGMLRAMHREIGCDNPLYETVGPYCSYEQGKARTIKEGEVAKMYFDLLPISYQFKKGHSLRISIAGKDAGHFDAIDDEPENLFIHMSDQYPSKLVLPFESTTPFSSANY